LKKDKSLVKKFKKICRWRQNPAGNLPLAAKSRGTLAGNLPLAAKSRREFGKIFNYQHKSRKIHKSRKKVGWMSKKGLKGSIPFRPTLFSIGKGLKG
jgi:hypothetical protein